MKKLIILFLLLPFFATAQIQMSQVNGLIPKLNSKQDSITRGTGFLKRTGFVWSYDNSTYLTTESDPTIYSWAKASTKPSYVWSEIGSRPTALSQFTNDLGNYGGWITGINSGMITTALGYSPGSVTSVATYLNSDGNDLSVATTNNTTAVRIDLSIPTASATKRGVLSSADWTNFNSKLSYISYNQPSNASYQMLWGSGNNIYGNSNITCNPYTGVLSATQFSGSGAGLTGLTGGQITTALGYTPWYSGNHPTTISGYGIADTPWTSYLPLSGGVLTGLLSINGSSGVNTEGIRFSRGDAFRFNSIFSTSNSGQSSLMDFYIHNGIGDATQTKVLSLKGDGSATFNSKIIGSNFQSINGSYTRDIHVDGSGNLVFSNEINSATHMTINTSGAATLVSTVNATGFLLNGNNLTSALSTNYIPKWNGSNFVNSLISDDGAAMTLHSTTASTSPTTGALVVGGGIGADHVRANNFYGSGSNLTGVQKPITLTTNNTSGAATFDGTTLNIPNYTSASNVVLLSPPSPQSGSLSIYGNITTSANMYCNTIQLDAVDAGNTFYPVTGSLSGSAYFTMPFRGNGSFKKVVIRLNTLNGAASWTFPIAFSYTPVVINTTGLSSSKITTLTTTGVTVTGLNDSGYLTIEGY